MENLELQDCPKPQGSHTPISKSEHVNYELSLGKRKVLLSCRDEGHDIPLMYSTVNHKLFHCSEWNYLGNSERIKPKLQEIFKIIKEI